MRDTAGRLGWRALVWAALAVLGGLLVARYDRAYVASDGSQYISVASNLLAGRGLSTSIAYYEEHYRIGGLPVPQTVFPPGYSLLIALPMAAGVPSANSALLVNLACFAVSVLVLYDLARARGHGRGWAALVAGLWALTVAGWACLFACLSETSFVLATLVSLRYLPRAGEPGRPLLAGCAAAAAVAIRYAGAFYLAAVALVLGLELVRERSKACLRRFALVVAPPLLVLGALFLRNHALVRDFKGGNDQPSVQSAAEVVGLMARALAGLFGFSRSGLTSLQLPELLLLASLVSLTALLAATRGARVERTPSAPLLDRTTSVAASYVIVSVALLTYLELTKPVGLSTRMVLPLWPFVLLLALEVASRLRAKSPPPVRLAWLTAGLASAAFLAGQSASLEDFLSDSDVQHCRALRDSFARSGLAERLAAEGRAGRPVLASRPQQVGGILEQPVLGLAEPAYTRRVWTPEAVRRLADAYGVRYVVFHPATFTDTGNQVFFRGLASGSVPDWLELETEAGGLRLYRLR
jgi:hypothetical protein